MVDIDKIIAFENGELDQDETVALFAHLIKTGTVWHLQGFYQRTAVDLMDAGLINLHGDITPEIELLP